MRAHVVTNEVTSGLRRNLLMTVALVITVMVSLLLVMLGLAVRQQAQLTKAFWFNNIEVSVTLCNADSPQSAGCAGGAVTQPQRDEIQAQLRALPEVQAVHYVSQQEAYERAQIFFKGSAILSSITPGVLPESYEVKLHDPRKFGVVQDAIAQHPGVDTVEDETDKLKPFFNVLRWMQIGSLAVAIVMLGVATLLIVNSIQLVGLQPPPRNRHQASGRRQQPLDPAAFRAGSGRRHPHRWAARRGLVRPRRKDLLPGQAAPQRADQRVDRLEHRARRHGLHAGPRRGPRRRGVVPQPAALSARLTRSACRVDLPLTCINGPLMLNLRVETAIAAGTEGGVRRRS